MKERNANQAELRVVLFTPSRPERYHIERAIHSETCTAFVG